MKRQIWFAALMMSAALYGCSEDSDVKCGNGVCDGGETYESCATDCHEQDPCGNGVCDEGETPESCAADCHEQDPCGNGVCDEGETSENCATDCPKPDPCGNDVCEADLGESVDTCPDDCPQTEFSPVSAQQFERLTEVSARFLYDYERVLNPGQPVEGEAQNVDVNGLRMNDMLAFPYPSALRTDEAGRPIWGLFELPIGTLVTALLPVYMPTLDLNAMLDGILELARTERAGSPAIGAVYFRLSQKADAFPVPLVEETAQPDSCFQLIDVEPDSAHYGERYPVYVTYHEKASRIWAENTVVMRPVPGVAPYSGDRLIAVIGNCIKSNGKPIKASRKLQYILHKSAPSPFPEKLDFYVDALTDLAERGKLGMALDDVRAFTGYQTMNPALEMDKLAADLKGRGSVVTDENGVAQGKYTVKNNPNYYVFTGTFNTVNYMEGKYPYDGDGEGRIRFDEQGNLLSAGKPEEVTYSVVIPRSAMPEKGYPIIVYGHGTGGDSMSHVYNEAATLIKNGVPAAMIGFDAVMHGDRVLDENGKPYDNSRTIDMISKNLVAVRDGWRQTVLDMLVIYDLLERGELVLPPVPNSTQNIIFDPSYGLYMGHSQGSQEGGLLLGLTGSIKSAVLSAGGGGILLSFVDRKLGNVGDYLDLGVSLAESLSTMKIADVMGMALELLPGELSYDAFITNHIVQALVEPIEPLNYTHRFIRETPEGMQPKNILQTIGIGDRDTPNSAQFAMITSEGLPTVGTLFEYSDPMVLACIDSPVSSPVSNNIETPKGNVTGGAAQFKVKNEDPHFAIYDNDSARQAYVDFFRSVLEGNPTITITGEQDGTK